jgi:1,3-beta-glucan synthase
MAAHHRRPSRSHEGYVSSSPPADMGDPFHTRQYYDTDAEPSETFHRDNYGSESSAAGLNDYDHPDPYGSSFT